MTVGPRRNALKIENILVGGAAIGSPVAIRTLAVTLILLGGLVFEFSIPPASAQSNAAIELEAAVSREQVYGDLAAAIASYQKIAADLAAPRSVRAKALLHLAACYEKLGKQAQTIYQQIVREFGAEPAAAQARARLAALKHSQPSATSTMTQRKIEIPGSSFGPQATDGRRMVYRDDATGELIYSEVATKTRRVIFKSKPDDVPDWIPSRDFSMVALQFEKKPNRPAFVALVQIDGKGYRELVRTGMDIDIVSWSWDNRYLVIASQEHRILVVSTTSGERRELITQETGDVQQSVFSPDGRFVACKFDQSKGTSDPSRIFVFPAQGGEPHLIREEADPYLKLFDWTADGRYLAIGSAHTGKAALHLLPVKDGQAAGEPILVQSGAYESASTTRAGILVYQKAKPGGLWSIHVASLNPDGRPGSWRKLEHPGENPTNPWPRWSPDSNQIVYTARDLQGEFGNAVVRVRNLATGADREIYRSPGHAVCIWGAQRPTIYCSQWTATAEILSIVPDSGQVTRLGRFPGSFVLLDRASGNDQAVYLWKLVKEKEITARWEIATGEETILMEAAAANFGRVSPDERWLVRTNGSQIEVSSISGGSWKFLASSNNFQYTITPDSKWLFFRGADSGGLNGLYRVPLAGGQPEHLGGFPANAEKNSTMEISPDGRRVVTSSYDYKHGFELWALDHFVPAASPLAR